MIYFAYGSLLDQERLRELSPTASPLRAARIPHHALCFTGRSQAWGGGTATIGLVPNWDLWGGLYEIDEEARSAIERSGVEDGYVWAFTSVEDIHGAEVMAGMLVKVRYLERSPPSGQYLEALRAGWLQWGLDPKEMLKEAPQAR
jgi:hypothetical protein